MKYTSDENSDNPFFTSVIGEYDGNDDGGDDGDDDGDDEDGLICLEVFNVQNNSY